MSNHLPDPAERAARNAALRVHGVESGFWDDHGRPAPWPDDIEEWRPTSTDQHNIDLTEKAL
jgi:hypothetical protein